MYLHLFFFSRHQHAMADHPFVSMDEAKSMFGPSEGPGANISNWGQNYCGNNIHVHHPKTYQEVAGLVKALKAQGAKVRVLGVMHSWSNVFADDGTHVIFLDSFKSITQDPNDYTRVTLQVRIFLPPYHVHFGAAVPFPSSFQLKNPLNLYPRPPCI